jgi:hypothetical protein
LKQSPKQLSLQIEFGDPVENSLGYHEGCVVRTKEESELKAYVDNVGFEPRNLDKNHPGYKLWTWKTKRDGDLKHMLGFSE